MEIVANHLTINEYSRPGTALGEVRSVVMHWVGNAGTSAVANRNFFESRKDGRSGYGSAHYIVGLDGEVVECIPPVEVAYHVGSPQGYTLYTQRHITGGNPNLCTLGVELCHKEGGEFLEQTLDSAAKLVGKLCDDFHLNPYKDITTHKAVVGWKNCPLFWCENPGEFQRFVRMVGGDSRC